MSKFEFHTTFLMLLALLALPSLSFADTDKGGIAEDKSVSAEIVFPVEKIKLDNGLVVLLHEDHTAPLISFQTWFHVGSRNEEPGTTGIAHLFEHMMFKGAKRYTGEQFDTILQLNGASNNAFTTHDYTGYYENMPSSKLEVVMDLESDRMENLQITAENLASEKEVVKEERRMRVDNSPLGVLRESMFQASYRVHPYRWPVIGYMADIDNISLERAQAFHKTYYAPNNAVIVISGDFVSAQAKALLQKYYGPLKAQEIPVVQLPAEPTQSGQRVQYIERPVQNVTFAISYHIPASGHDEVYALDLLANIMGHGSSSRLYKRLVYKDQVATSVSVAAYSMQDPGLFEVFISLKPQASYDSAVKAVLGEMWRPRNILVSETELETAKKQVMKGYVDGLKTVFGKAESLELNEISFGDYSQLFRDLDRYNGVTPQAIKAVAEKYLTAENSTITVLRPDRSQKISKPRKTAKGPKGAKGKGAAL